MDKKLLYQAEYAKGKHSRCKECKNEIKKDALRLVYLQKSRKFDGRERKCYHPCCFFRRYRPQTQFSIDGFAKLHNNDQAILNSLIDSAKRSRRKSIKQSKVTASSSHTDEENNTDSQPPSKKRKSALQDELDTSIRSQNEELHDLREQIKEYLDKDSQIQILKQNQQSVPRDKIEILDHVTDIIYFGAIVPCNVEKCRNGNFVFDGNTRYRCTGRLSEFGDCNRKIKEPERRPVVIPAMISEAFPFLNKEFKVQNRALKDNPKSSPKASQSTKPKRAPMLNSNSNHREMLIKDGAIVDPDSGLQHKAHVFIADGKLYSVALDKVDMTTRTDQNSYYKLQLLESDSVNPRSYWIYRSWGRINENIGDKLVDEFNELDSAVNCFHNVYRKKTANNFDSKYFQKRPKMYYQVPTTSKSIKKVYKLVESGMLDQSVQDLLKLLMNRDIMNAVMVKFCIDMNKMPLGKVKKKQILDAFRILIEIKKKIKTNESHESLVEASNRFYSIIPHKASSDDTLANTDILNEKAEMLKDLNSIQLTYEFLHRTGESVTVLDDFYSKLNTTIEPLDKNSEQFRIIIESVNNTKLNYDCEVEQIFKIQRNEEKVCAMSNRLPNRKLLWHGSRITNINLILKNGLKIAPREALVIGCMLGKGLYFSDVFANSAQYCYASQSDNIGVVLLCEVALGDSIRCFDPENIYELPNDKHSVHGVGKMSPKSSRLIDNMIIPYGDLITDNSINTAFDYNEFVVHKNDQVKIKYLVKLKFSDKVRCFN